MKEYAGCMSMIDLDGPGGCAIIEVRCRVSVEDARKLARLMYAKGSPLRVLVPEGPKSSSEKEET